MTKKTKPNSNDRINGSQTGKNSSVTTPLSVHGEETISQEAATIIEEEILTLPGPMLLSGILSVPMPMLGGMMGQFCPMIVPVLFQPVAQFQPCVFVPLRGTDSVTEPSSKVADDNAGPTVLPKPFQDKSDAVLKLGGTCETVTSEE